MQYRRLGHSGLKVSELSFGSWVTYGSQVDTKSAVECMAAAWDAGVNFFDNAEVYARGQSETIMGEALKQLKWRRAQAIISTKFFWGINDGPNEKNTLNRKYLVQAIDGSLKRLQLDYVDLVFCHRGDPNTPIEETVRAMSDMITQGKAMYWGTSEWNADDIRAAYAIAERHHLHKPVMEQPQYNLFARGKVEKEFARLYGTGGEGAKESGLRTVRGPREQEAQTLSSSTVVSADGGVSGGGKMQRPRGLTAARGGKADNLQRISGIGPKNEMILQGLGIFHFDQMAEWTKTEIDWVEDHLRFGGRIAREEWTKQARLLADGKEAEFTKLYGTGGMTNKKGETLSGSRTRKS